MDRDATDTICASLPGATWADPSDGSLGAWKVGGKMFAYLGAKAEGVSVKTPSIEDASLLIEMGRAERAPYFHRSWVRVDFRMISEDELRDRIETSYAIIRTSLTKKIQATLGSFPA